MLHFKGKFTVTNVALLIFLGSLATYSGWLLIPFFLVFLILEGKIKKKLKVKKDAEIISFLILGFYGVFLWLVYAFYEFGNPFYFIIRAFKSIDWKNINLFSDLKTKFDSFSLDIIHGVGLIFFILAILGIIWWMIKNKFNVYNFPIYLMLLPFVFYGLAFILMNIIGDRDVLLNLNYESIKKGILLCPSIAFFVGYLAKNKILALGLLIPIVLQVVLSFAK